MTHFILRAIARLASMLMYRFKARGLSKIPSTGPAVLACNHVSFVDAVLLMGALRRPARFVMYHKIFRLPVLGWFFRLARAIPIAPQKEDPAVYAKAFELAAEALANGEVVAIFPEGMLTLDGKLQEFKGGLSKILALAAARGVEPAVVPMALSGLWGSFFSRVEGGKAMRRPFRRGFHNAVSLTVGEPMAARSAQPVELRARVAQLLVR